MPQNNPFQAILYFLVGLLFGRETPPAGGPQPPVQPPASGEPVTRRVSLIIYNPLIAAENNRRLTQVLSWNNPDELTAGFINDLTEISYGYVQYKIVERIEVDEFPVKADGFQYQSDEFLRCWRSRSGFHQPDGVNYYKLLGDFDLMGKVKRNEIDEVWTFSFPYAGFYESRMAGPGAFWCNAPALDNTSPSGRRFVIMAFNYQRGVGEMLESYGHRAESIMEQVYRVLPADDPHNYWKRFIRYHKTHPNLAEVGNVHFAPNSLKDYDWGNPTPVLTRCRNWASFPDLSAPPVTLNCSEWGGGDIRAHHKWWFSLMPHTNGHTKGISHHWWPYIVDPNLVS